MPEFLALYHNNPSAESKMAEATPEQMNAVMQQWMDWGQRCGDGLVEMGNPLAPGHDVTASGASASDSTVSGYSILQADDADAANALLEGHPHLAFDESARIEIHAIRPM